MRHKFIKNYKFFNYLSILVVKGDDLKNKDLAISYFMQGEFLLNKVIMLCSLEFQDALDIDPNASTIHISIADAYRRLGSQDRLKII